VAEHPRVTEPAQSGTPARIVFVAANPSIDRLYEVDHLTVGDIHRPDRAMAVAGGKGLNAARAALTLGASVTAVGIVGGEAGDWILERLDAIGLDARMARSAAETRTCVSILDRSSGSLTEVYERGERLEPAAWEALEAILTLELDRGDVAAVALSGSLPPGAPPDGYGRLARMAAARSVRVVADTSGSSLAAVLGEHPEVVKMNAAEAAETTGLTVADAWSAAAAGRVLRERGAGSAIVTLGAGGAVLVSATDAVHLVPPDVRGIYPVGSGDAFLAGLAVGLTSGMTLLEAARLGVAAGTANAELPGAGELDPASVARHRVEVTLAAF
jgi:1-phosphofructokinase family hexose kinase